MGRTLPCPLERQVALIEGNQISSQIVALYAKRAVGLCLQVHVINQHIHTGCAEGLENAKQARRYFQLTVH